MEQTVELAYIGKFLEVLENATEHASLGAQQIQLLLALYTHGEMSQSQLMQVTGASKTTHSRNLAKLSIGEDRTKSGPGWIETYQDPMDRRSNMVRLTPKGRALLTTVANATFNRKKNSEGVRKS
jgi:DNA-binding MarR family transcriptional regulator